MQDRRHAPLARRTRWSTSGAGTTAPRHRHGRGDVFGEQSQPTRQRGAFRWLVSTSLAAAVGMVSVGAVLIGSTDNASGTRVIREALRSPAPIILPSEPGTGANKEGLAWALPKADRLQTMSGSLAGRLLIHETSRQRRNNRDVIVNRPYMRLTSRLVPVVASDLARIPAFNPYRLYQTPGADAPTPEEASDVTQRLVDLLGGLLPPEDQQELDAAEAADIVARVVAAQEDVSTGPSAIRGGFQPDGLTRPGARDLAADRGKRTPLDRLPPNTTALAKSTSDADGAVDDLEAREVRVVKVTRGQTLTRILLDMGGDRVQVRAMVEAAKSVIADNQLVPGHEVHVTLVPSLTRPNAQEPARVSVFGEEQDHKGTVARNAAGEFVASATPIDERVTRAALGHEDSAHGASLYAAIYHAGLFHGLTAETIEQILRIHAYETDFRRRARGSDQIEWLFDTKDDEKGLDATLDELLMTAITTGGETQRFFRFRGADGTVDYYDEAGNTSRKFLMRRPVRGEATRFTSGFGMRRHPVFNFLRLHSGVDWAGPVGTPIMAAGTGVIEEAGRKGEYGNYIRIRHPNGYKTAYAHMQRFAPGVSEGVRVTQGQVIGFLGNTGISSGAHLHYEVLVNNQPVDPMSIQVPRERKLTGPQLRDFLKERARIEDLARRNPVLSRVYDQAGGPIAAKQ
jgi:murein DD-endopeptidase MepM/ murein hydrolase activator NlpD